MGARLAIGAVFVVAACQAQLTNNNRTTDASSGSDSSIPPHDGPVRTDAGLGAWSTPAPIPGADLGVATNSIDDPNVNSTGLEIIYALTPQNGVPNFYVMTRATTADAWGAPTKISELASLTSESTPRLSPDDLTLYFERSGVIMTSTRAAVGGTWSTPQQVSQVNVSGDSQRWMAVCNGGYFVLSRSVPMSGTGNDLYYGQLGSGNGPGTKSSLSSAASDVGAFLSPDCLTIYFASSRADGMNAEIYTATRAQPTDDFGPPQLVADPVVNASGASQDDPSITPDQRLFIFTRFTPAAPNQIFTTSR